MTLALNPRLSVQVPQETGLPADSASPPQLSKTQAPEPPAGEMVRPEETELLKSYLGAVQSIVLGRPPKLVTVPPESTLGQWLALYRAQLEHPVVQGWMREQKIDPDSLLSINPSTGTLRATVRGEEKTFSLTDTTGWGQISGPLLAAAKVIAPGDSGVLQVSLRDGYVQVSAQVVANFAGVPLPATLAEGRAQIRQMEHKVAFDPISPDDRLRPVGSRSADALQVHKENAATYYSAAPQTLAYKHLAVEVATNLPNTRAEAKKWAEALIFKLTGKVVDADTIYFNRFHSYNTPPTGDPRPITGWEHPGEEPYSSLRLPDALLKNFSEHDGIPGTLDAQAGLYTVGAGESTKGGYGAHNEFPLEPSKLMHASWKTDFQAQMTQKIDNFWNTHAGNYETAIKGEFVYQARKQLKANEARSPAERALQPPEERFTREDYKRVMGAVSNLPLDENAPLTVEQLKTRTQMKGNVQVNALNIHGYTSSDIMRFSAGDGGWQALYIPGAVPAFLRFDSLEKLDQWVIDQTKDPKKRDALLARFPLLYHQDQTANFLSRLEKVIIPVLWFTHVGEKKEGLNTLFDKMAAGKLKDPVVNDKHSKIEGDVFQEITAASKERMNSDADVVIKSNSEVNRDTWLNDVTTAAGLLAKLAPIAAPVAAAAIIAGVTEVALGVEKSASGDTEAERNDGASKAFDGLLNTLFSVGASAIPEDPFARPPETELPATELPAPPKPTEIEKAKPDPSSGKPSVLNEPVPLPQPKSQSLIPLAQHAVPNGETLIKNATRDALGVYRMTDATGAFRQFVRLTDETGTSRVFEISGRYRTGDTFAKIINREGAGLVVVTPGREGEWARAPGDGGVRLWPWQRPESPTPSIEPKIPLMSDQFLEIDGTKMKGSTTLDKYLNSEEHSYTYGVAINDKGESTPQISWTVDENPKNATAHPTAEKSTFGTSEYSEQFTKDINRSRFTINTPEGITLEIDIPKQVKLLEQQKGAKLSTAELNSVIQQNIEKFETAIPNPALRARISEVANQWLLGAAPDEFQTSRFKGTIFGSGRDPHYIIDYDPAKETTTVTGKSDFILTRLDESNGELETLTDIHTKASRSITITASNEIDGNAYVINPSAPIRIEITPNLD
ncbi:dermonecrotic toxin domain-containing protein [Pseudomonas sp. D2002]|uniref:dermonecrotic toxin domain-containing protein n=1 Tax=Pseudomonas sp. D2002 TaxID=2726980 RepID=UPI0015A1270C|nr:DUF6543 domain-containing protein [Pseudomonas sp. D2002]NWA82725.1 hypothetical protein [Pseudomonas sp. D2002]